MDEAKVDQELIGLESILRGEIGREGKEEIRDAIVNRERERGLQFDSPVLVSHSEYNEESMT